MVKLRGALWLELDQIKQDPDYNKNLMKNVRRNKINDSCSPVLLHK